MCNFHFIFNYICFKSYDAAKNHANDYLTGKKIMHLVGVGGGLSSIAAFCNGNSKIALMCGMSAIVAFGGSIKTKTWYKFWGVNVSGKRKLNCENEDDNKVDLSNLGMIINPGTMLVDFSRCEGGHKKKESFYSKSLNHFGLKEYNDQLKDNTLKGVTKDEKAIGVAGSKSDALNNAVAKFLEQKKEAFYV